MVNIETVKNKKKNRPMFLPLSLFIEIIHKLITIFHYSDNIMEFVRWSEEPRHNSKKNFVLWYSVLLDMFLYQSLKTALKNTQSSFFYSILKLAFLDIFKNESFRLSKFKKKIPFMAQWASWYVSLSTFQNRTQKYEKLTSQQHFKVDIPQKFFKWKFSFFSTFSKFSFPTYARVPQIASHLYSNFEFVFSNQLSKIHLPL